MADNPGLCILSLNCGLKLTVCLKDLMFAVKALQGVLFFPFFTGSYLDSDALIEVVNVCLFVCADTGTALENGEQEGLGVQKPGKAPYYSLLQCLLRLQ